MIISPKAAGYDKEKISRHTGIPVNTYILMHADEVVAIASRDTGTVDVILPNKLPFGLRTTSLDHAYFMDWLHKRADNLQRSYMNRVYIARKIGRSFENVLRDSSALSIMDQFWIQRSDVDMTWTKLCAMRDQNETLATVALSGNTAKLDWQAAQQGTTSLFATKGAFPKAILKNIMLKCGGTQEREWVASVIGKAMHLPVQNVEIKHPSVSGNRSEDGRWNARQLSAADSIPLTDSSGHPISTIERTDDTLVRIELFTSDTVSLVHASELHNELGYELAHREGQHHRYFYNRLQNDALKRDFERVLILNWLISNHDMHGENFGCLYNPKTFEITGIAPSFDHNSADFDGTIPELDVPGILAEGICHHGDVMAKIESGLLAATLEAIGAWLTPEQKDGVRLAGVELMNLYQSKKNETGVS